MHAAADWKSHGMADKLGIGFCPTCNENTPEPDIDKKFAAAAEFDEIDMFVSIERAAWESCTACVATQATVP